MPAFPFPTLPQSAREGWGARNFLTATEFSSVELTTLILVDIFIRFREYILASLVSPFAGLFVSSSCEEREVWFGKSPRCFHALLIDGMIEASSQKALRAPFSRREAM